MSDAAAPAPAEAPSTPAPPDADADMTDAPPSEAPAPAAPEEEVDEATRERLRALDGLRAKIAEHKEVDPKASLPPENKAQVLSRVSLEGLPARIHERRQLLRQRVMPMIILPDAILAWRLARRIVLLIREGTDRNCRP